jgi:cyclophilin family peptidyl-prolyl cis-trans isomerase
MIQGGMQDSDGAPKTSPYGTIDLELHDDVKHVDGAISMARTNEPNTATSQFFICDGAQPGLDGAYAAFGKTIVGMSVVRDIADEPHDGSYGDVGGGVPYNTILINSITISNQ